MEELSEKFEDFWVNSSASIKGRLRQGLLFNIALIVFLVILPASYYIHVFDAFKISRTFPILTIVLTLFVFFVSLVVIVTDLQSISSNITAATTVLWNAAYILALFFVFSILFHTSRYIVLNGESSSIVVSFSIIMLFLAIIATQVDKDVLEDEGSEIMKIVKNIVFVIPCLISDGFSWLAREFSALPSSTAMMAGCIFIILISFYVIPFLVRKIKIDDKVVLLEEATPLDTTVIYLTQKELNDKIIESKSYPKRTLLKTNNGFKDYLESSKRLEGFNSDIHLLDKHINYSHEYNKLTKKEQDILMDAMDQSISIDDFDSVKQFQKYISNLRSSEEYPLLLTKIKEYNDRKNDFVYQEASSLIGIINRANHINDYNYHYGLAFWVYFDPKINIMRGEDETGLIMSYSNTPKVFYDYGNQSLVVTKRECDDSPKYKDIGGMKCKDNIIYQTKDILYQKWNLFVINFNYGTLDMFINNNLVLTKNNISPYIESPFLQFGSSTDKLNGCGICQIKYSEIPYSLTTMNEIYKNKENPCFSRS